MKPKKNLIQKNQQDKNMDSKLKEYLYLKLRNIQQQLEDRDVRGAMSQVESLINKIQYDQL